jgi:ferredoxin
MTKYEDKFEALSRVMTYSPETGKFFSKINDREVGFRCAGSLDLKFEGHRIPGSRLAWRFVNGEWPAFRLGFRDGDRSNLKIENLAPLYEVNEARPKKDYNCKCVGCGDGFFRYPSHKKLYPYMQYGFCTSSCMRAHHEITERSCRICGEKKKTSDFPVEGGARRTICQDCKPSATRAWYLKTTYGITPSKFIEMLNSQNKQCGICKKDITQGANIDHCHKTGNIRGLLCSSCNKGLGHFRDKENLLENAISYLNNPPHTSKTHLRTILNLTDL